MSSRTKNSFGGRLLPVQRPAKRCATEAKILDIQIGSPLHQQLDNRLMPVNRGLVQGRRMGLSSRGIEAIRVFPCVEQQANALRVSMLGRQGQGKMPLVCSGAGQKFPRLPATSRSCGHRQGDLRPAFNQRFGGFKLTMRQGRQHREIGIRPVIAKQMNERNLHAALTRHAAGTHQAQCFVHTGSVVFAARIQNHANRLGNIGRQSAAANRIFRRKLQQRRMAEVVSPGKRHTPLDQPGMRIQIHPKPFRIARVQKRDGFAENEVFDLILKHSYIFASAEAFFNGRTSTVRTNPTTSNPAKTRKGAS